MFHLFRRNHKKYPVHRSSNKQSRRPLQVEILEDRVVPSLSAGDFDPDFGDGGLVTTTFPGLGVSASQGDLAVLPDGNMVLVGRASGVDAEGVLVEDFAITRYRPDGTRDNDFGVEGRVTTDFGQSIDRATAVASYPDNRIVVAGETGSFADRDFALARYQANGLPDPTFHGDGLVTTDIGGFSVDTVKDVAVQSNGKIVVVGSAGDGTSFGNDDFVIARYNTDGSLDDTFGNSGGVITGDFGLPSSEAASVVIDGEGRIVVAGRTGSTALSRDNDFAVARFTPEGDLDDSFDGDGIVTTDISFDFRDEADSIAIDAAGRLVVAGVHFEGLTRLSGGDFAVARYHPDGSLDNSFRVRGRVTIDFPLGFARSVAIDAKGRIVVSGGAFTTLTNLDFAIARLQPDGLLDPTFGDSGRVRSDFGGGGDVAVGTIVQTDGNIVIGGSTTSGGFTLARYIGDVPIVESVKFDTDRTLVVQLNDDDLDPTGAEDFANYRLHRSGGDGTFDDGNEVNVTITSIQYDAVTDQLTIQTAEDLLGDFVRLQIDGDDTSSDGTPGVVNRNGLFLKGGDVIRELNLNRPVVIGVEVGQNLQSLLIQFDDNDLDRNSAANLAHYRLLAGSGDFNGDGNPFNDGDEFEVTIDTIFYNPFQDRVTLHTTDILFADFFRLELDGDAAVTDGTPGIENLDGAPLAGGDFTALLDLTPLGLTDELIEKLEAIGLSTGSESSLTMRLEAAVTQLEVEVPEDAGISALLDAFILGLNQAFDRGEIALSDRDDLIADADLILLGLSLTDEED
jgi:uncharacterized delta-60 repeat protein